MSWDEYLSYLSTRWMRRWTATDSAKKAEDGTGEEKEPWPQWWFGVVPLALKLLFYGHFRRLSR